MVNKPMDTAVRTRLDDVARDVAHDVARDVADDVCDEPGHRLLGLGQKGGCDAVEHEVGNATSQTVTAVSRAPLPTHAGC